MKSLKFNYINLIILLIIPWVSSATMPIKKAGDEINIKTFGAKGDGKTNDYNAFLKAASVLSKQGHGTLFFPKGIYYIGVNHRNNDSTDDVIFKNCEGLRIYGSNAVINVKGDFYRSTDRVNGKFKYSGTTAVIPFGFMDCKNVNIEGLEINGNVNLMKRDPDVVETGGHLIRFVNCAGVTMKNVFVHHAQSDGIYITGKCSDFAFQNVKSSNNGRQGMSIIQLINGQFSNCKFLNTGITGGAYGAHAPSAGVDIEPRSSNGVSVQNITFDQCTFENNAGGQFLCTSPLNTNNVMLNNCVINAVNSTYRYQMILAGKNIIVQNCKIDCGSGSIYPVWNGMPGSKVTLKTNTISSSSNGIMAVQKGNNSELIIDNNNLTFTGASLKSYFPYIQTGNFIFTNNKIFIPSKAMKVSGFSALVQLGRQSFGNIFSTDNKSVKPKVSYQGTMDVKDN